MTKLEWILGAVLIVLLIIVAGLSLSLWLKPDKPVIQSGAADIAPTPIYEGNTALAAAVLANEKAKTWQTDAKLYKASATWLQSNDVSNINSGASAWDFTYYSPDAKEIASMSVADKNLSAIVPGPGKVELSPLDIVGGWKVDSPEAVRILMAQGGQEFLSRENVVSMVMTLTTDNDNGRLEWLVGLFAPQSENAFTIRIDATSGDVLEVIQS